MGLLLCEGLGEGLDAERGNTCSVCADGLISLS